MSATAIARQLVDGLLGHADPLVMKQGQRFFKEPVSMVGVNAGTMRALARAVHKTSNTGAAPEVALAVCDKLLPDQRHEVKITALLFLACHRKQLDGTVFDNAQRWIESDWCNSWAVIDAMCIDVLGPILERDPDLFPSTRSWAPSPNMWLRRAGLVALVKPARRGLLLDEVYKTADLLLRDTEDLVQKAAGWLLREAGKTDMGRLRKFLEKRGKHCARTTLRYAIERFPEPTRRLLLQSTKSGS